MTPLFPPAPRRPAPRSGAFTLLEILVVIGIILLLSAIAFPVFKSIQERGSQTTCATNLQQIYLAVRLYKDDEREYPASLAVLLPDSEQLADTAPDKVDKGHNVEGTGYFRKTREELVCPDDDFQMPAAATPGDQTAVRSSYGDTSNDPTKSGAATTGETIASANGPLKAADGTHDPAFYGAGDTRDFGRLAWNYWGYDDWGQGFRTEAEAVTYVTKNPSVAKPFLRTPDKVLDGNNFKLPTGSSYPTAPYFNPRGEVVDLTDTTNTTIEEPREANMFKYSLSNPQAPLTTIITHCAFHRLNTAKNVISAGADQLYDPTASANGENGKGARDILLRLDGTARSYDVSQWNKADFPTGGHGSNWQNSDF